MSLTLILPCYNPPEQWARHIAAQYRLLQQEIPEPIELIIVKDGVFASFRDADVRLLKEAIPELKWIAYEENRGKGYAIRQGVAAARGSLVIYTDIDFPYDKSSFLEVYRLLRQEEADLVVGIKNQHYYDRVPTVRRIISRSFRYTIRLFFPMPITDTQCGLKGFNRSLAPLFLQTTISRYLFDLEFVRNCFRQKNRNLKIRALPVQLNEGVVFRKMNYRILAGEILNLSRLIFKKNARL